MKLGKGIFEVIFLARAGQGAKTAAEILAQAGKDEGKFVQAFPYFGPERSGAPTKAYLKISPDPIRSHEPIADPDAVIVMDDTLLSSVDVAENLDRDEWLIINTAKRPHEIKELVPKFQGKLYLIDANRIALAVTGKPQPNAVILGKIIHVSEIVKLESIKNKFREIFSEKIGKEATEKNILAMERGYDSL